MQFNFIDSYPVYTDGQTEPVKTVVILSIGSNEGHGGNLYIHLKGDHRSKTKEELIQLADDEFFKEKYSARATNEKIDEINTRLDEAIARSDEATAKNNKKIDESIVELTNLIMTMLGGGEDEDSEENSEGDIENGEN